MRAWGIREAFIFTPAHGPCAAAPRLARICLDWIITAKVAASTLNRLQKMRVTMSNTIQSFRSPAA